MVIIGRLGKRIASGQDAVSMLLTVWLVDRSMRAWRTVRHGGLPTSASGSCASVASLALAKLLARLKTLSFSSTRRHGFEPKEKMQLSKSWPLLRFTLNYACSGAGDLCDPRGTEDRAGSGLSARMLTEPSKSTID